ncbi:MAG: hypothetical protein L0Y60_04185 [Beijerinckiaceae bacterium]|nr:hypothetical protein [Beijerinckiaceae bacterium]
MTDETEPLAETSGADDEGRIVDLSKIAGKDKLAAQKPEAAKPETTEAESADASPEAQDADSGSDDESEAKPHKPSGSARQRARAERAEAERDAAREEVRRLNLLLPNQDTPAAMLGLIEQEIGPAPKEADFSDYLEFQAEKVAWLASKKQVERELKHRATQAQQDEQRGITDLVETFRERADEARKRIPDFDKILESATVSPQHPEVIKLILSSEKSPELSVYCSQNPEFVHRLNRLSPLQAALEIGRIENRLSSGPPKTATKAPAAHVPPLKGGAGKGGKQPWEMTPREYEAHMAKAQGR